MALLEIIRMGHPVLRQIASPIEDETIVSEEMGELVGEMTETLRSVGGIGLAAPQINRSIQLAIVEISDPESRYGELPMLPLTVFINPRVTLLPGQPASSWEGCLSIPGLRGYVERPQRLLVEYQDLTAQHRSMEMNGFLATVVQHEFDHLRGELYIDHIKDTRLLMFDQEFQQFYENESTNSD